MAKPSEHQVVKFVFVDFRGEWQRYFGTTAVLYTAVSPDNEIAVVKEVPGTGTATTYYYRLEPDAEAAVIGDIIHIPARCIGSKPEDTIRCG
jgi:hypothetical protein